jgi:hypothetical protein
MKTLFWKAFIVIQVLQGKSHANSFDCIFLYKVAITSSPGRTRHPKSLLLFLRNGFAFRGERPRLARKSQAFL